MTIVELNQILEAYDVPAILVDANYEILATNHHYHSRFGEIEVQSRPKCYAVSHGYDRPCDQAGEDCPLIAAKRSKKKEKVLHIHQTPNGKEHIDVEMIPIFDEQQKLQYFVELLRPVPLASGTYNQRSIIGASPNFLATIKTATKVAKTDASVLLLGESGVGKELFSHMIHLASQRAESPMVTLECAGLSETLIESELFGHKKGAFTGAHNDRIGLVEHADGGTLFLDEIGDVSLQTQVKLLRLIESKTFRRVGDTQVRTSEFRLVCATHRNLKQMVDQGRFRLDLYYRINVIPIHIPSLRERLDDIPELVERLLNSGSSNFHITNGAMRALQNHHYFGNIRELKNIIARIKVLCETNVVDGSLVAQAVDMESTPALPNIEATETSQSLKQSEHRYLRDLIGKHGDDKESMAKEAGVSLRTLYRKLESLNEDQN